MTLRDIESGHCTMLTQSYPLAAMALLISLSSLTPVTAVASPDSASVVWKGWVSVKVIWWEYHSTDEDQIGVSADLP